MRVVEGIRIWNSENVKTVDTSQIRKFIAKEETTLTNPCF